MSEKLIITPKTKVLQLIEAYPQLEEVLIEYVPAFKKLKNPILRNTVAKVASLQQAAAVGNVKVEDLINLLRKNVGQDLFSGNAGTLYNTQQPGWFDEQLVQKKLDAKELLAAGEQPVNQVMADLKDMPKGTIYLLIAPFLPAPLIDKATSLNIEHWMIKQDEGTYIIYFYK